MKVRTLVRQAWQVTRQYPWLWVPGLLVVGMASGNVDLTLPFTYPFIDLAPALSVPVVMGLVFVAGVLAVAGVALWIIGAVARGALITAADRLSRGEAITLGEAVAAGFENFGRLFLLGVPVAIPALLLTFLAYTAALSGLGSAAGDSLYVMRVVFSALTLLLVAMSLLLTLLQHFMDRAAVLERLSPLAALRRGWQLFLANRHDLRGVIALWVALTMGSRLLLALPTTGLILPALFSSIAGAGIPTPLLALVCVAAFLTMMLFLLFSVGNVFMSALWTVAYCQCLAAEAQQAQDAAGRRYPALVVTKTIHDASNDQESADSERASAG